MFLTQARIGHAHHHQIEAGGAPHAPAHLSGHQVSRRPAPSLRLVNRVERYGVRPVKI